MSPILIFAMITISLAFVFYTYGVMSERRQKTLTKKHVWIFWMGFLFDTVGTFTMSRIAAAERSSGAESITPSSHGVVGVAAILLMLFHATWATYVLTKADEEKKKFFHKFSFLVWVIWLFPYIVGMTLGMTK